MKRLRHHVPSPAMLVACLALAVALGGTAIAAAPLITGKQIRNGSIAGIDVRNNSMKGVDVLESSLATVPNAITAATATAATNAANAANADRLDGRDSLEFVATGTAASGDLAGAYPGPTLRDGAVTGAKIGPDAVSTAHVGANALRVIGDTDAEIVSAATDFPSIAGNSCAFRLLSFGGGFAVDLLIPVRTFMPGGLVLQDAHSQDYGASIEVCNTSTAAIDPGVITFYFVRMRGF